MNKDFISILDISEPELEQLLSEAHQLKRQKKAGTTHPLLAGKTLAMIFEKSSTRTHISFEVGMNELGGHALFLNARDMQIWRGEEIRDTARAASRYVSALMIRAYKHSTIEEFARFATIPVINGLSDMEHPCQLLADIMTMQEHFGSTRDLRVTWVGDGNNVCHSLILSTVLTGLEVTVSTPVGYEPVPEYVKKAQELGGKVTLIREPEKAVKDAEVIVTDTWVSMGDEDERDERLKLFGDYTVDADLMKLASPDARVLHCLPAHRGEEITDEVMEGGQSLVWDEAENRLHAQKALLVRLLKK
ncbi:ornithine carbamoyltransferase [Methanoregula formicica]|uniref:Ornithine carbamoyltransferase n=1 Tax=Methanoregula formicica (strain DSM 22288 / NBRC 105244 / SMSP) TaxID=593750 RepID=L0HIJ0_METFS|nr:ornithine carbamoyltransferase [Methanoregula formicica]AGB03123.1 ornithine carbamoyltransferase [Methanoregula formicica SMSP]